MRVTRMPYLQPVNGKYRVRVVVPDELIPIIGQANLTKALGTGNEREAERLAIPHIAEFLAKIEGAREWAEIHQEAAAMNGLSLDDLIRRGPAPYRFFAKLDRKMDEILGQPVWKQTAAPEPVTFEDMIKLWGRAKDKPAIKNMEHMCGRFIDWLEHDNMRRVSFQDGRDWRDDMIFEEVMAPGTIANHLKAVRALFNYTFDNEHITGVENPMARVKYAPGDGEERDDFTPDERRRILTLAREAPPHIYWLNWICSFHGCRNGEVADMSTRDIEIIDGMAVFNISKRNRSKDQGLKTTVSTRKIALHQAVLDEGFIDYRSAVCRKHGDGPLFPTVKLDLYGRRAGTVTTELSEWLRREVGITDPRKPFYSHRHTATSYLRNTLGPDGTPVVKEDIERYILGHGRKGSHGGYGKHWLLTLKRSVEVIPNPLV
jgi:integrase